MKKQLLFIGFLACILISSCKNQQTEGVTEESDIADTVGVGTTKVVSDTAASSSSNPSVDQNNYKHSNVSKSAKEQLNAEQDVDVVYREDATGGNYKNSTTQKGEVVTEKSTTTQNKVETGNSSNDGNYKKQNTAK